MALPLLYNVRNVRVRWRLALLAIFLIHVWQTVRRTVSNRQARPERYEMKRMAGGPSRKSIASSSMIFTGLFIILFTVLHLKTFKWGAWYIESGDIRDLARLVVEVFTRPLYVVFYVVSMILIGAHLWHGVGSAFQSLGVDRSGLGDVLRRIGWTVAIVLALGFFSIPLYFFFLGGRS